MKFWSAIWLSLVLVFAPALVGAKGAASESARETATCCPPQKAVHCPASCCQISDAPSAPEPVSVPAAPVQSRTLLDCSAFLSVLWVLPLWQPDVAGPAALAETPTLPLTSVPLFLRHAALLI